MARIIPLLAARGLDTMRLPDPGKKQRPQLDDLLRETPDLAVLVDTYEQPVQRHKQREEADRWYSGKQRAHTVKTQVGVDERDGRIVDMPPSVPGPTADLVVLKGSGLLPRLPPGMGIAGDLAYVGMDGLHLGVGGATPRRKPRGLTARNRAVAGLVNRTNWRLSD